MSTGVVASNGRASRPGRTLVATLLRTLAALAVCAAGVLALATPASAASKCDGNFSSNPACTQNLQDLSNGLAYWALLACVGGIIVSASLWAVGSKGQNPGQELTGKRGLVVCCTAAFFIGALPGMVNYLNGAASTVQPQFQTAGATDGSVGGDTHDPSKPVTPNPDNQNCTPTPGGLASACKKDATG